MAIKSLSIRIEEEQLNKLHILADYEGRSANSAVSYTHLDVYKRQIGR